jgi:mRNA interferase RelE/StbE
VAWTIECDLTARKSVEKLDRQTRHRLRVFIHERLANLEDQRNTGSALKGSKLGNVWRYRVGGYRIVCDLRDQRLVILVVEIGHRREVYR